MDPLIYFFMSHIEEYGMIDIKPIILRSTWRNMGLGHVTISKRLDILIVSYWFMNDSMRLKKWIRSRGESNHFPILLEIDLGDEKRHNPFKFKS